MILLLRYTHNILKIQINGYECGEKIKVKKLIRKNKSSRKYNSYSRKISQINLYYSCSFLFYSMIVINNANKCII